jgi:methionyl-tRNA synthetase
MHKLCGGKVPKFHNQIIDEADKGLILEIGISKAKVDDLLEQYRFRDALYEVIDLARKGNKYMQDKEPWKKVSPDKTNASSEENQMLIDNCLHLCLQLCANLAILVHPFLPNTAKKMCYLMKVVDKMLDWENAGSTKLLSVGYSLRPPELLFRKIEDSEVSLQIEKLRAATEKKISENPIDATITTSASGKQNEIKPSAVQASSELEHELKPMITYEDFSRLDLRIGTIISAEKVEKADKLLKLQVEMGYEQRTIVSGIAQHFSPESLLQKQVIVVANLAPRKMRGIESAGMILLAEQPDGQLVFVTPENLVVNGMVVR